MNYFKLELAGVYRLQPTVLTDTRGFFFESFNAHHFNQHVGGQWEFVQDNHSRSSQFVLRGLHYQLRQPQGKLVRVIHGEVFDVAVDLRRSSVTLGCWVGWRLSAENKEMLWIPPGLAHGFFVLSESADIVYKTTAYYSAAEEHVILWNDRDLAIKWPFQQAEVKLSAKDQAGVAFKQAPLFDVI